MVQLSRGTPACISAGSVKLRKDFVVVVGGNCSRELGQTSPISLALFPAFVAVLVTFVSDKVLAGRLAGNAFGISGM